MKKVKSTVPVIILTLIFASSVQGEVITIFDSNTTISSGDYDTVVVKGDGTVVDMTGGSAKKLITMNSSTFNMSGGTIQNEMYSYESSMSSLTGGNIGDYTGLGNSEANISGNISISSCTIYGSAIINVSSDSVTITDMTVGGAGKLNISGGDITSIHVNTGANITTLSGGSIDNIGLYYGEDLPEIRIVGYSLSAVPYGGNLSYGLVTGNWNDDTPFDVHFNTKYVYSHIILYDGVIPTQCTSKPESDLSDDCKVDFVDFARMASEWLYDGTQ